MQKMEFINIIDWEWYSVNFTIVIIVALYISFVKYCCVVAILTLGKECKEDLKPTFLFFLKCFTYSTILPSFFPAVMILGRLLNMDEEFIDEDDDKYVYLILIVTNFYCLVKSYFFVYGENIMSPSKQMTLSVENEINELIESARCAPRPFVAPNCPQKLKASLSFVTNKQDKEQLKPKKDILPALVQWLMAAIMIIILIKLFTEIYNITFVYER